MPPSLPALQPSPSGSAIHRTENAPRAMEQTLFRELFAYERWPLPSGGAISLHAVLRSRNSLFVQ